MASCSARYSWLVRYSLVRPSLKAASLVSLSACSLSLNLSSHRTALALAFSMSDSLSAFDSCLPSFFPFLQQKIIIKKKILTQNITGFSLWAWTQQKKCALTRLSPSSLWWLSSSASLFLLAHRVLHNTTMKRKKFHGNHSRGFHRSAGGKLLFIYECKCLCTVDAMETRQPSFCVPGPLITDTSTSDKRP